MFSCFQGGKHGEGNMICTCTIYLAHDIPFFSLLLPLPVDSDTEKKKKKNPTLTVNKSKSPVATNKKYSLNEKAKEPQDLLVPF